VTDDAGLGAVYVPKGWSWDRDIQPHERRRILERVMELPAWLAGRPQAENLDVKQLTGLSGFFRLRVGRFRAIFQRLGRHVVVQRIDRRDDVYDEHGLRAMRFVRDRTGLRVLARRRGEEGEDHLVAPRPPATTRAERRIEVNPLSPFSDSELADAGLKRQTIDALRRLPPEVGPDDVLLANEEDDDLVALVAEMWNDPKRFADALGRGEALGPHLVDLGEDEAATRLEEEESATSFAAVADADAFAALLARPIEDWMVYLHPSQVRPVNLGVEGPLRVRGGAGTGKTVVALHRARRLADRDGAGVLLTTFVSTLPRVWEGLFETFAPEVRGRIDMRTVDSVAMEICRDAGEKRVPADETEIVGILSELHRDGARGIGGLSSYGLREEFDYVLTGRGIRDLDAYLELPRAGRGSPLPAGARRNVWELYRRYLRELDRRGKADWHLIRRLALDALRRGRVRRRYDAVVVDEAQDLTESAVRLLVELSGGRGRPNLTVVGDGQQSLYPGGFSLLSLGVDVRGRSFVLRTNWRNTYAIWEAAKAFITGLGFDDLGEDGTELRPADEETLPLRDGRFPRLWVEETPAGEGSLVASLVADDIQVGADPGGCAVLAPTNSRAKDVEKDLRRAGVPTAELAEFQGRPRNRVWVGTFHRAKGLEFKNVYVVGLSQGYWPPERRGLDARAAQEEHDRSVRAAFVAMTRARDNLDIVVSGAPASELADAAWAFDR
jgi:mRNA-degrading endonuclease RelE of RelBE toxin-antitoxin system